MTCIQSRQITHFRQLRRKAFHVWVVLATASTAAHAATIVTGLGAGAPPLVSLFDAAGSPLSSFLAYASGFSGGVRVAVGDVNADGVLDIVTGSGPGALAHVKVFSGTSGAEIASFLAFGAGFTGGAFVAAGDINGDKHADIIVGADAGGGPQVTVFSGADRAILRSFFAYAPGFTGGVRVGSGDVNGDGIADIVTGAGAGGGSHVKVFDGATGAELKSFLAFGPSVTDGIYVAVGDVNGDDQGDIVVGTEVGAAPLVNVFSGATGALLRSFFAYAASFTGGVRVAAGDVNNDGFADIVTGAGLGGSGHVKAFDGVTGAMLSSFLAGAPGFAGGIYVATGEALTLVHSLSDLIAAVGSAGGDTHLLENAAQNISAGNTMAACNMISAFIHNVEAQSGKQIPPVQAGQWILDANRVRGALGCP